MKLKFKNQQFQEAATAAVCDDLSRQVVLGAAFGSDPNGGVKVVE